MRIGRVNNIVSAESCAMALTAVFALPQIGRPFWQDEVATLELFAASGLFYPFTDYRIPNNHMLSSAVLALMRAVSDSPLWLRLWPLASTLLACVLLVMLARRLGGHVAAWLSGIAFACSGITQAFAVQLRGYAPSWPCLLLAALAVAAYVQGRWRTSRAMMVFALASLAGMALLPTNLPWLLVLAAIAVWLGPADRGDGVRMWSRLPWLALPAIGLLAYAGVFAQLVSASGQTWNNPDGRWGTLVEVYGDMLQDMVLLLPLSLMGLILSLRNRDEDPNRFRVVHAAVLLLLLLAPLPLWLFAPHPPFSRAVVPWWPLMILALALAAAPALQALGNHWRAVMLVVGLAMVANAMAREVTGWRPWPTRQAQSATPQTLLLHYYRTGYRPDLAAEATTHWMHDPKALVWSDYSDFPSLHWYTTKRDPDLSSRLVFVPDADPALLRIQFERHPIFLVSRNEQQACVMLAKVNVACNGRLEKIADSGYFKGFRIRPKPERH
jgi:hypothetical protein